MTRVSISSFYFPFSLSLSSFATVFWDEESEVEEYGAAVNSERAVNGAVFDLVSVLDLTTGQL